MKRPVAVQAGKKFHLKSSKYLTEKYGPAPVYIVEDWFENVLGQFWMNADGNPAAMGYAIRSGFEHLPLDNDVLYGKINGLGELVHVFEIGEPA